MKKRQDENYRDGEYQNNHESVSGSGTGSKLSYLLVGGGIGAVLALLFAPKSGTELRTDISDATRKGVDRTRETANQLGQKSNQYLSTAKQKAGDIYNRAGGTLNTAKSETGKKSGVENEQVSNQLIGSDFGESGNIVSNRNDNDLPVA